MRLSLAAPPRRGLPGRNLARRAALATSLAALVGTLGACAGPARHKATSRVHFYDDARLTVISPAVRGEVEYRDTGVGVDYALDVVSGATQALTIDAVSAATRFSEQRHQVGVSARHALSPSTELSGAYAFSVEPDHVVHAPSLGVARELLERMVRASVRYQVLLESTGRVTDDSADERALGHRVDLGWTQIATPKLIVTALATATAYGCAASTGCFANPYRYVGVEAAGGDRVAVRERHPGQRVTGAGALRVAWALSDASALHAGYRLSADSWDVLAHTEDVALATELGSNRLLARLEARATQQGAASFYRPGYAARADLMPAYRTADAELSALWNLRLEAHLEWNLGPVRVVGELGRMWNQYPNFPALPQRTAWLGGLGLDADLE